MLIHPLDIYLWKKFILPLCYQANLFILPIMAEQMARQTHLGIDGSRGHKNREVADAGYSDFLQLYLFILPIVAEVQMARQTNSSLDLTVQRATRVTVSDAGFTDFHTASRFNFWHLIPVAFLSDKNRISEDLLIIYIQM